MSFVDADDIEHRHTVDVVRIGDALAVVGPLDGRDDGPAVVNVCNQTGHKRVPVRPVRVHQVDLPIAAVARRGECDLLPVRRQVGPHVVVCGWTLGRRGGEREQGGRGLAHFKEFLARKAHAAKKAAELQAAQKALTGHAARF